MILHLGPLLYTLEFQIQFLHFALVLHLCTCSLGGLPFPESDLIDTGYGHNQHNMTNTERGIRNGDMAMPLPAAQRQ